MSDVICIVCGHGPHTRQPCTGCGCKEFVNAELAGYRSLIHLNNLMGQKIPLFEGLVVNILEIMVEAFPEAVRAVDARREEMRRQLEAEKNDPESQGDPEASQQQRIEADSAGQDAGSGRRDGEADSRSE